MLHCIVILLGSVIGSILGCALAFGIIMIFDGITKNTKKE